MSVDTHADCLCESLMCLFRNNECLCESRMCLFRHRECLCESRRCPCRFINGHVLEQGVSMETTEELCDGRVS